MPANRRYAKINVKVLVILIIITGAIILSLFTARHIRRRILSKIAIEAAEKAYASKDWVSAYENYKEYLARNPDDIEILKKYAEARLAIRPIEPEAIGGVISAYRRILQLGNKDKEVYEKLALLYAGIGNYDELAYIAQSRLDYDPGDKDAPLWLADAKVKVNRFDEAQETLTKLIKDIESLPEKYPEYVKACLLMAGIQINVDTSSESALKALEWHNKAVEYSSDSAEALVYRAKYYLEMTTIAGISTSDRMNAARRDLEAADTMNTSNPQILFSLALQWLELREYEKASNEIKIADGLSEETIKEYYLDIKDFEVARYLLAAEIAFRSGDIDNAISLIDESLELFTEDKNRIQFLPTAVKIYTLVGKVDKAREYLDEYNEVNNLSDSVQVTSDYLQALVAMAEGKPYLVIDTLQSLVANNSSPEFWRLLADAYSKTQQHRRAVTCILNYLNYFPNDIELNKLLAKEYFALGQWNKAFEAASNAVSLNADDLIAQLIRIESGVRSASVDLSNIDKDALDVFSNELADLRMRHTDNAEIRLLQSLIAEYLGQMDLAESQLKQAIIDCNETTNIEMQLANLYKKTQRISEAADIYEAICKKNPDSIRPWLALADIYIAKAEPNISKARNCLEEGIDSVTSQKDKYSLSTNLALFEMLYGEKEAGIDILKDLAEKNSEDIQVRLMLLEIQDIQQDATLSQSLVDQIKEIEGQAGQWWRVCQARLWLSSDQWRSKQNDIIDMLQNCITADTGWTTPVLLLIELYKKQGDFKRVEDICKQSLAINPMASDVANQLLLLLESQGRFSDAEQILEQYGVNQKFNNSWQIRMALNTRDIKKAIDELKLRISDDKDENDANSRIQLARLIYEDTKDSAQALEYLEKAQEIQPDNVNIPGVKASILKADGRSEEAIKVLNEYVESQDNFSAYRLRGMYYENEGEYELAEQDFKKLTTFEDSGSAGYQILSNFFAGIKQVDKAIATIEEGLLEYPDNSSLERSLMRLLVVEGPTRDIERAGEVLEKLEQEFSQDSELIKFKAALLMENPADESSQAAMDLLEELIDLEPRDIDAYLMFIRIATNEGKYDVARKVAIQGLGINSDNPQLSIARSRVELESGDPLMAAQLANSVLQKYPANTDARDIFIRAALTSRDNTLLKEAERYAQSAIKNNPADEKMIITRTSLLMLMDQAEEAIDDMAAYCQTESGKNSVNALMALAELYRITGDMENAKQMIQQASELEPDNLSVKHLQLLNLVSQKKYSELPEIINSYLSAEVRDLRLILDAAIILISTDSQELKEDGIKLCEYAYTIAPDSKDAGYNLASVLYSSGNSERAEEIYQKLLEKFPDDVRVLNDYAWILQDKHQDYTKSLELANHGLKLSPNDLHLLDTRGTILLKSGNQLEQARIDFEKIVELSPSESRQQAKAYFKLARISAKLIKNAEAKQYYQHAFEINQKINVFTPEEVTEIQEGIN